MEPTFALEVGTRSLANLPNFRAASLPPRADAQRPPQLYRSGYLERLSAEGVQQLRQARGVRCIIDLRGARELRRTLPGSHVTSEYRQLLLGKDGRVTDLEGAPVSAEAEAEAANRRYTIDFLGFNFFYRMFMRLPLGDKVTIGWSLVTSLYTGDRGYEGKAAEIVLKPRGLTGQCCDFVDFCQVELATVLRLLGRPENLPCLVHCFLGKDRTGLVVMLLQWLVGVPRDTIEAEYQMSHERTEDVRHEAVRYYAEKNLPASFADCSVEELRAVMQYIETNYGGVEAYLSTIGLTQQEIDRLRENFGSESAPTLAADGPSSA